MTGVQTCALPIYQIAVYDDEPAVCDMVAEEIKKWNQDIKVLCFHSGEALITEYDYYDAKDRA